MYNDATLPLLLKQLGLPTMLNNWETHASQAQENNWTYSKYLGLLSELEVSNRTQKRIMRHIKESKLPPGKSISQFNFTAAKSINAAQIMAHVDSVGWVKQAKNLVIFGPSGVGKTHLASAIGYSAIEQGIRVLFTSATALVQKLQKDKSEYKLPDAISKLTRIPLLIIDDIGYVKKDESESSVLFELIADRYESNSLIITSNQPFGEWDQIFPTNMMAVAAIDRLVHHSTIINIQEDSYRKVAAKLAIEKMGDNMN
jgi:DNA replication protein DnaC